jgi:hypothetical protein
MDALSDVLRVVRLKGGVFLHAEFTAPWCVHLSRAAASRLVTAAQEAEFGGRHTFPHGGTFFFHNRNFACVEIAHEPCGYRLTGIMRWA